MMISPADLTYFVEIARASNLSRAAERLGMSQPSLTLAIKRIEHSLKAKIFIRSKKGVSLTQAGKTLFVHAKMMLQYWEQIKIEAKSSVDEISGKLSIGCHPSVGFYTLDKFLPKLLSNFPKLEISLIHDLSRNITEQVISLEIDVGIVINPVRHPHLIIKTLLEDTVTLWISENPNDAAKNILICDPALLQSQDIIKKLKKNNRNFSRIITSSSLENIANLTAAGAGVGILPTRIAEKIAGGKLVPLSSAPQFKDVLAVIYRMENRSIKSFQYLIGEIIKTLV